MNKRKGLIIIGAGGHGRVVADIATCTGKYQSIAFLDDGEPSRVLPYPRLGKCDKVDEFIDKYEFVVAIGNGAVRQRIMQGLINKGACLTTIIAQDAIVAADVQIGAGTVVCPGVVINTGTVIGQGVILNTACSVDHDCIVNDFCHVAVGAHICGTVTVGEQSWIGAGATVINDIAICPDCTIGAGAVVVEDITISGKYLGIPARRK